MKGYYVGSVILKVEAVIMKGRQGYAEDGSFPIKKNFVTGDEIAFMKAKL